jgi:glycosyltransferase involved in cell wall biosynthesis
MATIDVLLPVRNRLPYLREAIDSIRSQTFSDWRLLILDHGSDDGSARLSYEYADLDSRIEVFSFPQADGIAELRNLGLAKSDCKYLFLQDADDISLPNRFSTVLNRFDSDPEAFAVGGDAIIIDESGAEIGYQRMPVSASAITVAGFFHNPIFHPAVAANFSALKRHDAGYGKDFLRRVPPTDSLSVPRLAEDYMLFGQLALLGRCLNVAVPLIKYRRHGGNSGNSAPLTQIELSLQISRFLAKSFCAMKGLPEFDPGPFCNHAENVFDFGCREYKDQFEKTAGALRSGLGSSPELERELAFRWILATRNSSRMTARYLRFHLRYGATPTEMRTVRNWLLRGVRNRKYVYAFHGSHQ